MTKHYIGGFGLAQLISGPLYTTPKRIVRGCSHHEVFVCKSLLLMQANLVSRQSLQLPRHRVFGKLQTLCISLSCWYGSISCKFSLYLARYPSCLRLCKPTASLLRTQPTSAYQMPWTGFALQHSLANAWVRQTAADS